MLKVGSTWTHGTPPWDHKGKSEIVQIFISRGESFIIFIQFLYCEDGGNKLVLSEKIGGDGTSGSMWFETVTLDYPSEFITCISGKYVQVHSIKYLRSITFDTNRGRYGPFESRLPANCLDVAEFKYEVGRSKFGGFFGSSMSNGITGIGIYVKPLEKLLTNTIKKE